jgi:hypothetical protein
MLEYFSANEALKSIFGCFGFDVAEAVRKRRGSTLQLSKDSFVPISVATDPKSESSSLQYSLAVMSDTVHNLRRLSTALDIQRVEYPVATTAEACNFWHKPPTDTSIPL